MKTNPFKLILRSVAKKPLIHFINFTGLVLSITVVVILSAYCLGELNANKFNDHVDNTYIIASGGFDKKVSTSIPGILKEHIEANIPEVKKVVRVRSPFNATTLQVGENPPISSSIIFADSTFVDVFTYECMAGSLAEALKIPMSIILTQKESLKLFGNASPIGKTLKMDNKHLLTVRAVIDEPQAKSSLLFKAIVPIISIREVGSNGPELTDWGMGCFTSFILTNKSIDTGHLEKKIAQLYPADMSPELFLLPFNSIYFSDVSTAYTRYLVIGQKSTVVILGFVALIILFMGIINYLNLSFSITLEKLKSIGVMKVIGASKTHIVQNSIAESVLFFLCSVAFAYLIAWAMIPFLGNAIGIEIYSDVIFAPVFLLLSVTISIAVAVVSVLFPSLRLSSINPVESMKKTFSGTVKSNQTRRVLVITQFAAAITLIAFTVLVQKQVKYGAKQLGYNNENILTLELTPQLKKEVLREKLRSIAGVKNVAFTSYLPGKSITRWYGREFKYKGKEMKTDYHVLMSDSYFPELLGLSVLKGRLFSPEKTNETNKIIVNKAFVDTYGLDEAIGLKIPGFDNEMEIIGVVDNFHFQPVHNAITPAIILNNAYPKYCYVKTNTSDFNGLHHSLNKVNEIAAELSPGFPVNIDFLDASVAKMYKEEVMFRKTFSFFSGIAILICCLGILGLSIFASQQKTKEIGIRKVTGAKVSEILTMLNGDFIKWVAIAFVVACPVAYFAMNKWLQNFAYKTSLSWWIFALAGVLALGIALLTVSWQSWRAATRNPVEALRYE